MVSPDWPRGMIAALAAGYVGLSPGVMHRLISAGDFPAPIRLTPKRAVWLREDLDAWLDHKAGRVRNPLDGSEWMNA